MATRGQSDSDDNADLAPGAKRGYFQLLQPPPSFEIGRQCFAVEPAALSELETLMGLTQHPIMKANDLGDDVRRMVRGSTALFCATCGAYIWGAIKSLCETCPAPKDLTIALRRQRFRTI